MADRSKKMSKEWRQMSDEDLAEAMTEMQRRFTRFYLGYPNESDLKALQDSKFTFRWHEARLNALKSCQAAGYSDAISSSNDLMHKDAKTKIYIDRMLDDSLPSDVRIMRELCDVALSEETGTRSKVKALKEVLDFRDTYIKNQRVDHTVDGESVESLLGLADDEDVDG